MKESEHRLLQVANKSSYQLATLVFMQNKYPLKTHIKQICHIISLLEQERLMVED